MNRYTRNHTIMSIIQVYSAGVVRVNLRVSDRLNKCVHDADA